MSELTPEDVAHLRAAIAHPLENRPWRDWLEMTLDALAAEKAAREEAQRKYEAEQVISADNYESRNYWKDRADKAVKDLVSAETLARLRGDNVERLYAERDALEARLEEAVKERDEWQKAAEKHAEHARFMVEKSDHFERKLADLKQRITALADEWEDDAPYVRDAVTALRALLEKRT